MYVLNLLIYLDPILDLVTASSAMFVVLLSNFVFSLDSHLLKVELPVYCNLRQHMLKAAIDLPVKSKALELLSDQPSHSPPPFSLSLSFCYPLWQGASHRASELLKLGQTTPLGISWSRPRRRSSPRGEVRMSLSLKAIFTDMFFVIETDVYCFNMNFSPNFLAP